MAECHQWLASLPEPNGLLKNVQREARETLINNGLPSKKLEAWRLTDLKRLRKFLDLPLSSVEEN